MYEQLSFFRTASAMARHASARHQVIARNIANADTPGFRAQDVKPFADIVKESFTATRPGFGADMLRAASRPRTVIDRGVDPGPNGNSVSLEREMIRATEAQDQHALAAAIYRKGHDLLRLGLGRGR